MRFLMYELECTGVAPSKNELGKHKRTTFKIIGNRKRRQMHAVQTLYGRKGSKASPAKRKEHLCGNSTHNTV